MAAPPPGPVHSLRWHIAGAWAALTLLLLTPTYADVDLWGHTRFGLDWLAAWSWPADDPYSFLQGRPWINHEWLSEALMGAAFQAGGPAGLILLKIAIVGIMLYLLFRRLGGATPLVIASTLTVAVLTAATVVLTVRPHLWSLAGLAALVTLIDTPAAPSARRIAAGAALFACWANLHGGWVVGGAVLGAWIVARSVRQPRQAPRWLGMAALCLAATLANPYGVSLWLFLVDTVRASRPDITEWTWLGDSPALLWMPVILSVLLPLLLSRDRRDRPPLEVWAVIAVLIVGAVRVGRVSSLAGPTVLVLLAPRLARAWGQRLALPPLPGLGAAIFAVPVLVMLAGAGPQLRSNLGCIRLASAANPDTVAAAALHGRAGRLWNTFDWGEYAIWHFGPALRVAIDGRRETIYPDDVLQWTRAAEQGEPAALARMLALEPEYVWLPASRSIARSALVARGYRIDAETSRSFVAVRSDQRSAGPPAVAAAGCFP